MRNRVVVSLILFFVIAGIFGVVSAENNELSYKPMILRNIKEIKSVSPSDVANLGFGVYEISAQYNLGAYHQGKWLGEYNRKDKKTGALWIEFSWDRPETNIVLIDGAGNERKIYLPASTPAGSSTYGEYYWISEDGSSYYAHSSHTHGWPDLSYEKALVPEHLARKTLSLGQKNPEGEEPIEQPGNMIKIKGQIIDKSNNQPVAGAQLGSAYQFSPDNVVSDSNGNVEFFVSADFGGSWTFSEWDCYGYTDAIVLQKNYQDEEKKYDFALIKEGFDSKKEVIDISGRNEIDIGKLYTWPQADISVESDIKASFNVMYKYKNKEGYNGPGDGNYRKEHYLTNSLPLDYETFIQFNDESGKEYKSDSYTIPANARCGIVLLKYFNGKSEWSVLSAVEPTEESGPIDIDIPDIIIENEPKSISNLCFGCLKKETCYPLGYRKSGEFCSEDKKFISQLSADSSCDNNFECSSNVCISGSCVSEGLLQKILNWFRKLFGKE